MLAKPSKIINFNIIGGFSTRHGGVSESPFDSLNLGFHVGDKVKDVYRNRAILLKEIGAKNLAWMEQVHTDNITVVYKPGKFKKTDGLITVQKDLALMVMVADCIPVLFHDLAKQVIAVAHAGREGVLRNISGKMINKMQEEFKSDPKDIMVSLGPSIKECCYEVGADIASSFKKEWGKKYLHKKQYLNLTALTKDQLLTAGILEQNIKIDTTCTHCSEDYFSHRRNNPTGRFAGIIIMK